MKFRVHLRDGSKFDTDEHPDQLNKKYGGAIAKIKRIKDDGKKQPAAPEQLRQLRGRFA